MAQHLTGVFIPQCDADGNYKPVQCSGSTGYCWCVNSLGQEVAGTKSPPGRPPSNCVAAAPPKTKCEQERDSAMAKGMPGVFIPECDADGNYKPVQCSGSTGYCWCVNSMGQQIAGTNTPPGQQRPNCVAAAPPKTKCEQERDSAMAQHLTGVFIPQCDADGNYKPVQCSGSTGYCWCVNSLGQEVAGTKSPPGRPPSNCVAAAPPKTKCEQERDSAMAKGMPGVFIPECDANGNYKPVQCSGSTGYCWCVNSMGQQIAGTNTPPGQQRPNCVAAAPPKTKCEQERDSAMAQHLTGVFIPQCDADGNYKPVQCSGSTGYCWCVNSLGQEVAGTKSPPGRPPSNCVAAGNQICSVTEKFSAVEFWGKCHMLQLYEYVLHESFSNQRKCSYHIELTF
ncbi:thyroglobulin-like [Brachyhypopomus gauderio]|uniref:thyroglobulin-like n=1 Tax=Brachyhypopomus gauderio TaxID=698409 RepID=UPI004041366A